MHAYDTIRLTSMSRKGTRISMRQSTPPPGQATREENKQTLNNAIQASRWEAFLCTLVPGVLYYLLPDRLTISPSWLLLVIEGVVLLSLLLSTTIRGPLPQHVLRATSFLLLALVTAGLLIGVVLLITTLDTANPKGANLLTTAITMYLFNVVVFALWYWEVDGGGPYQRYLQGHEAADFLFPQQTNGNTSNWVPRFLDYLFLAFTGATAFSPTDTIPLTRYAKLLMMVEAIIALMILTILAGHAVNIL